MALDMLICACRLPAPQLGVCKVHTPNPGWKPREKQPHPYPSSKMLQLVPEEEGVKLYPFVISAIVPRPIAFISSLSKEVRREGTCISCLLGGASLLGGAEDVFQ